MPTMKKSDQRIDLRLPAELHARLVKMAHAEDRSLNNLTVRLVRQALACSPSTPPHSRTAPPAPPPDR
jgi:predicted HicB family RNase H-like nuclease